MVKRCTVQNCGLKKSDGVSLHQFPTDRKIKRQWVKFMKTFRKDWEGSTPHSRICSRHFLPEDFKESPLKAALGFQSLKPELKEDAVPSRHWKILEKLDEECDEQPVIRSAVRKREQSRTLQEAHARYAAEPKTRDVATQTTEDVVPVTTKESSVNSVALWTDFFHRRFPQRHQPLLSQDATFLLPWHAKPDKTRCPWPLHFNENAGRSAASNRYGEAEHYIQYPKSKGGGYVVRRVTDNATYGYVDRLLEEVYSAVQNTSDVGLQDTGTAPSPLCSSYERPDKAEAVRSHYSRFNIQYNTQ